MSYSVDIRTAYTQGNPVLFWKNREQPFIIASESVAQSGNVCIVRALKSDLVGFPMTVQYIVAKASHILAWKAMAKNNPFSTSSLASSFIVSGVSTVMFDQKRPLEKPSNMVLRDDFLDIGQTIFDSGSGAYRRGFDVWTGILHLIICS